MKKQERILTWHFLPEDKRLRWGSRSVVEEGKTYRVRGPLEMCKHGLHASKRLIDALTYAPGPWICRVEVWGDVEKDSDKLVARNRKVLRMVDGTRLLHEFACDVAEIALKQAKVTDKRCWAAIETKRLWLDGKATDKELAAARDAARNTAWGAVWNTAWDAAGAAVGDAARAAAGVAVWDAANTMLTKRVEKAMEKKS